MMSNLNAEGANGNVHIWSSAPLSVNRAYHKILRPVKTAQRSCITVGVNPQPKMIRPT
jgi:hypothetical protein